MSDQEFTINANMSATDVTAKISAYENYTYPFNVIFTNLMPFNTVFPVVNLFLKYAAAPNGANKSSIKIANIAQLQAVAGDIWAVATLNNNLDGIKFSFASQNASNQENANNQEKVNAKNQDKNSEKNAKTQVNNKAEG